LPRNWEYKNIQIVKNILREMERRPVWLCRKAGISPALFTLMAQGERSITRLTRRKISRALRIPEKILFNDRRVK